MCILQWFCIPSQFLLASNCWTFNRSIFHALLSTQQGQLFENKSCMSPNGPIKMITVSLLPPITTITGWHEKIDDLQWVMCCRNTTKNRSYSSYYQPDNWLWYHTLFPCNTAQTILFYNRVPMFDFSWFSVVEFKQLKSNWNSMRKNLYTIIKKPYISNWKPTFLKRWKYVFYSCCVTRVLWMFCTRKSTVTCSIGDLINWLKTELGEPLWFWPSEWSRWISWVLLFYWNRSNIGNSSPPICWSMIPGVSIPITMVDQTEAAFFAVYDSLRHPTDCLVQEVRMNWRTELPVQDFMEPLHDRPGGK